MSWLLHRFKHAYREFSVMENYQVIPTGQFFGFARLVSSAIPVGGIKTRLIFCMDSKDKATREGLLETYKEGRPASTGVYDEMDAIIDIVKLNHNVDVAVAEGFEADDLLASLAFEQRGGYDEVIVYTGDNDLLQLIPYGITVSKKMERNGFIPVGDEYIKEKFGVPGNLLLRYRILVGDTSDNIPPVAPRLNKEFCRLLAEKWGESQSLDQALEKVRTPKNANNIKKIEDNKANVERNLKLMSLVKYRIPEQQLKPTYKLSSGKGWDLIERYKLNQYREYLTSHGILPLSQY